MDEKATLRMLQEFGAIITNSHIVYTSGKHGTVYVNKDALYPYTDLALDVCREIARGFLGDTDNIEMVIGPAIGGAILSQ